MFRTLCSLFNKENTSTKGSSRASVSFDPRASDSSPPRASVSSTSRASVSSALRASVTSDHVKKFELVNCYIQKKDGTFGKVQLFRNNDSEFHDFCYFKQIIFRQYGKPDLFLLVKTIPTFDQIKEIAATNGFKTPIGLQTFDGTSGSNIKTFLFKFNPNFGEKLKYYVIFEGDEAVVTLNLGLSSNGKDVFIYQHLAKVNQTLFLQMGRIKYILQFSKLLTWNQLNTILSFYEIIGDNQVSRVVGQEYYNNNTDESPKEFYICTGGSILFDCGFIELTKKLEHRSNLLSLNNLRRKKASHETLSSLKSLFRRYYIAKLKKDASSTTIDRPNSLSLKFKKYRNEGFTFNLRKLKDLFICYIAKSKSTTIQACFRGYRSRKELKSRKSQEIKRYNTTILIQSLARGYLARISVVKIRNNLEINRHNTGVILIQSRLRGFLVRRKKILPNGNLILGIVKMENNSVKKEEKVQQLRRLSQKERLLKKKNSGKELWGG